jgi:hypothetical protein
MEKEMKKFRDFESARKFAQKLGLKYSSEWRTYCNSGNKPDDIPSTPDQVYKNKGWNGWGVWLRNGEKISKKSRFCSLNEAREFVRKLNLKSMKEWQEYCKSGNKPDNIPANPESPYKGKGWKGYGDWLGTGTIANVNKQYLPFNEAREFVRKLNLKTGDEWNNYCNSGNKPDNIPINVAQTYRKKGWIGIGDFLGSGNIANKDRAYRSYNEAREFVHKLKLKNRGEWEKYYASGKKPDDIPASAGRTYKNEWKGWGDFLGTGRIPAKDITYRSFDDAKEFAHGLKLNSRSEWIKFCNSDKKPIDIPIACYNTYKNEWKGWGDFLGTGNLPPKDRVYRPFNEAREFVRKLNLKNQKEWESFCQSGKCPNDIPFTPWHIYGKKRDRK